MQTAWISIKQPLIYHHYGNTSVGVILIKYVEGNTYLSSITYLIIHTKYQQIKTSLSDIKLQHHSPLTHRSLLLRLYDRMIH